MSYRGDTTHSEECWNMYKRAKENGHILSAEKIRDHCIRYDKFVDDCLNGNFLDKK